MLLTLDHGLKCWSWSASAVLVCCGAGSGTGKKVSKCEEETGGRGRCEEKRGKGGRCCVRSPRRPNCPPSRMVSSSLLAPQICPGSPKQV